ncbi:hypothetical protein [Polyangium spumosum]|uniref:Uncharacterized protein n=1 Tax=Polyangium spumosum TaxID=889282 RepID=A0A6N7Q1X8_9BACT|nr:hypothetical protein [Polyangium spumosum]MRG98039.1 hypothetical protein [Polyangium spumosum]
MADDSQATAVPRLATPFPAMSASRGQPNCTMLKISQNQIQAFEASAQRSFEEEMTSHIRTFAPRRCREIDDGQLRMAVRDGINRARVYEFTNKGPIRLFLETMLLFGAHFDTDPQYPVFASQLSASTDQMVRAERIYDEIVAYQSVVLGQGSRNLRDALAALIDLARSSGARVDDFDANMLQALASSFPKKAAYVGRERLQGLIRRGRVEASGYGLHGARAQTILVTAMFALGHGISRDWLYPAVQQALADMSVRDTSALAERFESTLLLLLERTLADISKEAQ